MASEGVNYEQRRFNHDLLVGKEDQESARVRWRSVAELFVDNKLIDAFMPHEVAAKRYQRLTRRVGSVAVLLLTIAVAGSAVQIWNEGVRGVPFLVAWPHGRTTEYAGIVGLLCSFLASRWGPFRRRWLKHRFVAETLRQWHFRTCLKTAAAWTGRDRAGVERERSDSLQSLLSDVRATLGQKMDRVIDEGLDSLGSDVAPTAPREPIAREQFLNAYFQLRMIHQIEYFVYKLSVEDQTFLGLSNALLIQSTDVIAGTSLMLALGSSLVAIVVETPVLSFISIVLTVVGAGVRAWRDGFALSAEQDRYRDLKERLKLLQVRWERTSAVEERLGIAVELEMLAFEELRSFIRDNERAQFVF